MAEIELALAASARSWSDRLHHFLADHGGARVRAVVMGPGDVVEEDYQVLLIDDVCSFLTPRLVEQVRRRGSLVVGVFEARDGSDAKRRLLDCGVDDVIEAEASPDEFLDVIRRVYALTPVPGRIDEPTKPAPRRGRVLVVGSPPGGCGASEVTLALARALGAVAVDADDVAPSLAQRMGVPLYPNLRTAIEIVHHREGGVEGAVTARDGLRLVSGLAVSDDWAQVRPGEVEAVIDELAEQEANVVVNVGAGLERPNLGEGRFGLARSLVGRSDVAIGVGLAHPVGITRLLRWLEEAAVLAPDRPQVAVLNRMPRSGFRRAEAEAEITRVHPGMGVFCLAEDRAVAEAAWEGTVVGRGPFRRGVERLAEALG